MATDFLPISESAFNNSANRYIMEPIRICLIQTFLKSRKLSTNFGWTINLFVCIERNLLSLTQTPVECAVTNWPGRVVRCTQKGIPFPNIGKNTDREITRYPYVAKPLGKIVVLGTDTRIQFFLSVNPLFRLNLTVTRMRFPFVDLCSDWELCINERFKYASNVVLHTSNVLVFEPPTIRSNNALQKCHAPFEKKFRGISKTQCQDSPVI